MVNGSSWTLTDGESIKELDEARIEYFSSLMHRFRQEPELALYRAIAHPSYEYFLALPTDDTKWSGEAFECESLSNDSTGLHLANRSVDGDNRLIILHVSAPDEHLDVCQTLEERSARIVTIE